MSTFDGVLDIEERALNRFASGIHEEARTTVLRGVVPVAHLGLGALESVEHDLSSAPSDLFDPSSADGGPVASLELVLEEIGVVLRHAQLLARKRWSLPSTPPPFPCRPPGRTGVSSSPSGC